jgi:hypothetical protein
MPLGILEKNRKKKLAQPNLFKIGLLMDKPQKVPQSIF